QGPQHALDQHRVQAVEPVAQTPENRCSTRQQPGARQGGGSPTAVPPGTPVPRGRTRVRRGSAAPTGPRPAGVSGRSQVAVPAGPRLRPATGLVSSGGGQPPQVRPVTGG